MNPETTPVVRLRDVSHRYGKNVAVDSVTLDIAPGKMIGFIGPDGTGKSTLLSLMAGARKLQAGAVEVLDGSMSEREHRERICNRVAYMPQGLGKNLYPTLSVNENIDFFGRLFGQSGPIRKAHIEELLKSTGLSAFRDRPAGQLSGGMKQKLGICCSLIHDPELLILDEPTTGVDPLSRQQFWDLITHIRSRQTSMSVIVATAYMEEAEKFDWLVAMDAGKVLATGSASELRARTGTKTLDEAFIQLLPENERRGHHELVIPPREQNADIVIEAHDLTKSFGKFRAVDHVTLNVQRGEIFGFLGSNGCGKSTTMKMLTGLLSSDEGEAKLFGKAVTAGDLGIRRRVGYMSQAFSLYTELTVRQNLRLHAQLYHIEPAQLDARLEEMTDQFNLGSVLDQLPEGLPLGVKQRLSLAVAVIHRPSMLILDEPTSGVDPIARDGIWELILKLSRSDGVTIFISTHFMNEAGRCDRISLMNAGRILATDQPAVLVAKSGHHTLEETFIAYLEKAQAEAGTNDTPTLAPDVPSPTAAQTKQARGPATVGRVFSLRRLLTYTYREALELKRDPFRLSLAFGGTLLLMVVMGLGISLDVDHLPYAVLDHDNSRASFDYALNLSGSRYFIQKAPIADYAQLDRRMRNGELSFAVEIPPNYGRDLTHGVKVFLGLWIDGSNPLRANTVVDYLKSMHSEYVSDQQTHREGTNRPALYRLETRYQYNADMVSVNAMVPTVIALLLLFIPSILMALGVVREKELGSILNLYVTPVTKLEFLIGKQIPYVVVGLVNFILMTLMSIVLFRVPISGNYMALLVGAVLYLLCGTGLGLLISTFMETQIAAIFGTAILTLVPAIQFSGLLNPVSSLSGGGAFIGHIYPTTYFLEITRGTFAKGLGFSALSTPLMALAVTIPVLTAASVMFLKKQEK